MSPSTIATSAPAAGAAGLEALPHFSGWWIIPFGLLLFAIAAVPFVNRHWWERHYPKVSYALGLIVVVYYLTAISGPEYHGHGHHKLLHTLVEYYAFIALLASLFVVAGGIHLDLRRPATPGTNVIILLIGSVIANFLGTTGASMLLIRPFLRINQWRVKAYHVVFFIFLVSNIGGALTPIGDPPLFMGYLKGVPFFWVAPKVWHIWLFTLAIILFIFYVIDRIQYAKVAGAEPETPPQQEGESAVGGAKNFAFLALILVLVLIQKAPALRQYGETMVTVAAATAQLFIAIVAYKLADRRALERNDFNFEPIREVAILFAGIFATMIPALDYLEQNARSIGIETYSQFYWGTGVLSAILDNTPTYLNFLSAAFGIANLSVDNAEHMARFLVEYWQYLQAISVSAVFFGAVTYIGNGPNFMVKTIAEHQGAPCPSFVGYVVKYALPILIPVFFVVWAIYFRGA